MPSQLRLQRIADRIRQELSEMLVMSNVRDPRLTGIFITDVKVDRELAYADVYASAVEGQERAAEILAGLNSASGFLRRQLAERVELRVFPGCGFIGIRHLNEQIELNACWLKFAPNSPLNPQRKHQKLTMRTNNERGHSFPGCTNPGIVCRR